MKFSLNSGTTAIDINIFPQFLDYFSERFSTALDGYSSLATFCVVVANTFTRDDNNIDICQLGAALKDFSNSA